MGNKQWRHLEEGGSLTNEDYATKLMEDIRKHDVSFGEIQKINILLVGPAQAGKSSFINSVSYIDKERSAQPVIAEKNGESITKTPYVPGNKLKNFALFDTVGAHSLSVEDFTSAVEGNIIAGYEFKRDSPIQKGHKLFMNNPSNMYKMHCVVFVVDANVLYQDNVKYRTRRKLEDFKEVLKEYESITKIVLLTKIDVLDKNVDETIAKAYTSEKVRRAVEIAEELFDVSESHIFPVKNHLKCVNIDRGIDILILLALRQMIFFTSDNLETRSSMYYKPRHIDDGCKQGAVPKTTIKPC